MPDTSTKSRRIDRLPRYLWVLAPCAMLFFFLISINVASQEFLHDWQPRQRNMENFLAYCTFGVPIIWIGLVLWRVKPAKAMVWHFVYTLFLAGLIPALGYLYFVSTFKIDFSSPDYVRTIRSPDSAVVLDVYHMPSWFGKSCDTHIKISDGFWPTTRHWADLPSVCPEDVSLHVEGDRIELRDADGDVLAHSLRGENATMVAAED